jgi:Heat shock factor binding protein 1
MEPSTSTSLPATIPAQLAAQTPEEQTPTTDAAAKLAEAIDDFLGDLEKKFKGISNEVLNKLDDMAERCDRLEAELLAKEAEGASVKEGGS